MKLLKRLIIGLLILIVVLAGAAILVPILYKDQIVDMTKREINNNVYAKVDFEDASLSLLKSFPDLNLSIDNYTVVGIDSFAEVPLASGASAEVSLDVWSVLDRDRPLLIKKVKLDQPDFNILVLENGKANYEIMVPTDERIKETAREEDLSGFRSSLAYYEIKHGRFTYDDRSTGFFMSLYDLDHIGRGDFTLDIFDLDTKSTIGQTTVRMDGITYLNDAQGTLDAKINIDVPNNRYTLKENHLAINDLVLEADGWLQLLENDDIDMNFVIQAPGNAFKDLLSIIPNAYTKSFENVNADGDFKFNGTIKGIYSAAKERYPAMDIEADITHAHVKYPDMPIGIRDINARLTINSPGGSLDNVTIESPRLHLRIGDQPFDGSFYLSRPISDPTLRAHADGVLDLSALSRAFPMEGVRISGRIDSDMKIDTRMSYIEQERYDEVNMSGGIDIQQLEYEASGIPKMIIPSGKASFTPRSVDLTNIAMQLGRSDLVANGRINNILAYFSPKKTMTGQLHVSSMFFDMDEWMGTASDTTAAAPAPAEKDMFDRFDFTVDARAEKVRYAGYDLTDLIVEGRMQSNQLVFKNARFDIGDTDISGQGTLTGMWDYLFEGGTLGGDLDIASHFLNLNQFMIETEEGKALGTNDASPTPSEPILIPERVNISLLAKADALQYEKLRITDISGQVHIADQAIIIEASDGKALGGTLAMSGGYDTSDPESPAFNIKYDINNMNFQDAFAAFNTFRALAPVGQYINGKFNSSVIMDSKLGNNLMPILSSLNAQGNLLTLDASIKGFKPLEVLGNALNIKEFTQSLAIKNSKNWFEVKNGLVEVKPFDVQLGEFSFTMAGTHGLNREMQYTLDTRIPRERLGKIGDLAGRGLGALSQQASRLGINLNQGNYVDLRINLTGSLTDPKVAFKLLGISDGDGEPVADIGTQIEQQVEEQIKTEVTDRIDQGREELEQRKQEVRDSIARALELRKAEAERRLREQAGQVLDQAVDSSTREQIKDLGKDAIDETLRKWNPFKKKKKDGDGG